jgi:hypothetical protein
MRLARPKLLARASLAIATLAWLAIAAAVKSKSAAAVAIARPIGTSSRIQ